MRTPKPQIVSSGQTKRRLRKGDVGLVGHIYFMQLIEKDQNTDASSPFDQVNVLLKEYQGVFGDLLKGLALARGMEHIIELEPNIAPIIITPYTIHIIKRQKYKRLLRNCWRWATSFLARVLLLRQWFCQERRMGHFLCVLITGLNKLTIKKKFPSL